jgi:hypothetical protein
VLVLDPDSAREELVGVAARRLARAERTERDRLAGTADEPTAGGRVLGQRDHVSVVGVLVLTDVKGRHDSNLWSGLPPSHRADARPSIELVSASL